MPVSASPKGGTNPVNTADCVLQTQRERDIPIDLSIVIVNFNGMRFLDDCLRSIADNVSCRYEVIVVDNASVDESCAFIRSHYPNVRLIESSVNTGFTVGNNIGVHQASADFVLLLNNDTQMLTDIAPALQQFTDPRLGALGCRLYYGDGRQQPSFGFDHTPLRIVLSWLGASRFGTLPNVFRRIENRDANYTYDRLSVDWVSGAFLMTRKDVWMQLGGLDERYFMYVEDVDYCKRVRDLGYRVAYLASIEIIHHEGAGRAWVGGKALLNTMQSYLKYSRKFHGHLAAALVRAALCAVMLSRAVFYGVAALISTSPVYKEKNRAYFSASKSLLKSSV